MAAARALRRALGGPGPRLPRRLALGGWRRPWAPRSRSLSRGRGRGGPLRPPRLSLLGGGSPLAAARTALAPGCASASLQVSRSPDRRAGNAEPGHTPSPGSGAAPPKPAAEPAAREPAPAVTVTCCGAARSPGRPPARDAEGLVLRWPPAGSAAGSGVGGRGRRSCRCTARSGRTKERFRTDLIKHLQSRDIYLQISGIPLQYRIREEEIPS
ncbi:cbp/p300-interacting transactivator 4-like [Panthera tigris]|uniref:cbp/p300-interacting transactivator 4-like n=1 Tax=Panthera tigris TaxID=9694 RepID=UPI001C6F6E38|nr:cbp/p300-interacting transactivator 4-like [Panthera tigris]